MVWHWGYCFMVYRPQVRYWLVVEAAYHVALGCLAAIRPTSLAQCQRTGGVTVGVVLLHGAVSLAGVPYHVRLHLVLAPIGLALQAAGLILQVLELFPANDGAAPLAPLLAAHTSRASLAAALFFAGAVVIFALSCLDALAAAVLLWQRRRESKRQGARGEPTPLLLPMAVAARPRHDDWGEEPLAPPPPVPQNRVAADERPQAALAATGAAASATESTFVVSSMPPGHAPLAAPATDDVDAALAAVLARLDEVSALEGALLQRTAALDATAAAQARRAEELAAAADALAVLQADAPPPPVRLVSDRRGGKKGKQARRRRPAVESPPAEAPPPQASSPAQPTMRLPVYGGSGDAGGAVDEPRLDEFDTWRPAFELSSWHAPVAQRADKLPSSLSSIAKANAGSAALGVDDVAASMQLPVLGVTPQLHDRPFAAEASPLRKQPLRGGAPFALPLTDDDDLL